MAFKYTYYAVIRDQSLLVHGRNVWEAADYAAVVYRGSVREGQEFFRGDLTMALWRTGMERPVFSGRVSDWLRCFEAQRRERTVRRWRKWTAAAL